jgi:phospholipid/cholesterol/gamma-HCH transport system permease protein
MTSSPTATRRPPQLSLVRTLLHYLPWEAGHRREFLRNLLLQIYFTFVQSTGMVMLLGFFAGVAIAFQANMGLTLFGGHTQLGRILVFIVFRELAPLAAAMLMIARSCTAIASEMATIKVQQEVEALRIMGISVYHYIIAPRVAGGTISLFCMAVAFWAAALAGGWFGANYQGDVPINPYITAIAAALTPGDFLFFTVKTLLVGGLATSIAARRGLAVGNATFEVPIVTNRAVVDCLTTALTVQVALSATYYALYGFVL